MEIKAAKIKIKRLCNKLSLIQMMFQERVIPALDMGELEVETAACMLILCIKSDKYNCWWFSGNNKRVIYRWAVDRVMKNVLLNRCLGSRYGKVCVFDIVGHIGRRRWWGRELVTKRSR